MIIIIVASLAHLSVLTTSILWTRWKGEEQVLDEDKLPNVSFDRSSIRTRHYHCNFRRGSKCFRLKRQKHASRHMVRCNLHDPHRSSMSENEVQNGDYTLAINAISSNIVQRRLCDRGENSKINVLVLMSDTGGGHRASAQALEAAFNILYPNKVNFEMVDILTEHSHWPMNSSVRAYQYAAKNPIVWRAMYETARFPPSRHATNHLMVLQNFQCFRDAIAKYDPDMIVSIHPLTQNLPLKVLRAMSSTGKYRELPFVTIVTDLGGAHPTWFDKQVDKVFIATDTVMRVAFMAGMDLCRIHNLGLPTRPAFWSDARPKSELREELGLDQNSPAVMVVGGGDGVGGLGAVAAGLIKKLGQAVQEGNDMQIVVVCGKNTALKKELEEKKVPPGLRVKILGFVKNMDEWMGAIDVIVTKAGPGTIAEATVRGLPIMLSGYLPGQEEGNVSFVVNGGFGAFSSNPKEISETVTKWLLNPDLLFKMSMASRRAARPSATFDIAKEIGAMLFTKTMVDSVEAE